MKKALYTLTIFSLFALSIAPALAVETDGCGDGTCVDLPGTATSSVSTGFQRSIGGGDNPIIKAKWEMLPWEGWNETCDDCGDVSGMIADDSCEPGAQFAPTGEWDTYKEIYVCAIATDPDGVSDIDAVYADVFYPENIALGPMHSNDEGCGEQHGYEIELQVMDKEAGYDLFCDNIYNDNYNLPTFNEGYNYEEICAQDGELMKETAYVYCKYTHLKWEDPAGDYRVQVHAADVAGLDSVRLENYFEYLPLTAFEVDFTSVNYDNVKLNTHKIINGDLTWGPNADKDILPSVRNVGNTRLVMTVWQDDMGLGQTVNGDQWWNVQWDARVGSDAEFAVFDPFVTTELETPLELSQMNEMDFSILVKKFPLDTGLDGFYDGQMVLGAVDTDFLECIRQIVYRRNTLRKKESRILGTLCFLCKYNICVNTIYVLFYSPPTQGCPQGGVG